MNTCCVCHWTNTNLRRCAGCGSWLCYGCWYDVHDFDDPQAAAATWDGETPVYCGEECEAERRPGDLARTLTRLREFRQWQRRAEGGRS